MARGGTEIRNVIVKLPKDVPIEDIERKACRAYAKVLCNMYPPGIIDRIVERLDRAEKPL